MTSRGPRRKIDPGVLMTWHGTMWACQRSSGPGRSDSALPVVPTSAGRRRAFESGFSQWVITIRRSLAAHRQLYVGSESRTPLVPFETVAIFSMIVRPSTPLVSVQSSRQLASRHWLTRAKSQSECLRRRMDPTMFCPETASSEVDLIQRCDRGDCAGMIPISLSRCPQAFDMLRGCGDRMSAAVAMRRA